MRRTAIVVTGLPASGKSTLARHVAREIGLAVIDKDDVLEKLYDTTDVPDRETRRRLSRQSDADFIAAAGRLPSAVLISHWRNAACDTRSGTPVDWIGDTFDTVVELYCQCPVDTAVQRFQGRTRHPGHRDHERTEPELSAWFSGYALALPIGLGTVIPTNASMGGSAGDTIRQLRHHLAS